MHIHPLLRDPYAVLITQTPLAEFVAWDDFRGAAMRVMAAMQIELEGERVVIKPNVTSGEHFANPNFWHHHPPGFCARDSRISEGA